MLLQSYVHGRAAVNIAAGLERAIAAGRLPPNASLPTVRSLAATLRVSPTTVTAAYRTLRSRGFVSGEGRRGTRVTHRPPIAFRRLVSPPRGVRNLTLGNPDRALLPPLDTAIRSLSPAHRLYGAEPNFQPLVALARRQFVADGIPHAPVTVVSGALDGIERVLREHARPGDRVAVEDPCFSGVLDLLSGCGLQPVPMRVDDDGPLPEGLREALDQRVSAVIVTPRAQNPTGAALTPARAAQLKAILRSLPDVLIIEDDHAGPVAGVEAATICDYGRRCWAVVRSVSKFLGPDLRVALMTGDERTIDRVEGRQSLGVRWVSHLLQELVYRLLSAREAQGQLRQAAETYRERRDALVAAVAAHGMTAHGRSGLNVWIPVLEESPIVQGLSAAGWAVTAGERFRLETPPAVRVTVSDLQPGEARRFAAALAGLVSQRRGAQSA